jgi:hypothetical protein
MLKASQVESYELLFISGQKFPDERSMEITLGDHLQEVWIARSLALFQSTSDDTIDPA